LLEFWQAIDNGRGQKLGSRFESPAQALQAAMSNAQPTDRIVVFGSFYTVGGVLVNGVPKLPAQHMS